MLPAPAVSEYVGFLQEERTVGSLKLVVHRDSILPSEKTTYCGIRVQDGGIWHVPESIRMTGETGLW
jgi:hypothetical protein